MNENNFVGWNADDLDSDPIEDITKAIKNAEQIRLLNCETVIGYISQKDNK